MKRFCVAVGESNRSFRVLLCLCLLPILLGGSGCATAPYHYGTDQEYIHGYRLPAGEPQISFGTPHGFLDASGWIWPGSLMGKLLLWNHKMDSHIVSTQTVAAIRQYLADNDLRDVKVRINDYCVGDEWRRTFRNKAIAPGWRYTFGFLSWLEYTIMPQRFFGGDNYNPYSNTINIYSDLKPVVLHESGHSKDFAGRTYKGTYAAAYGVVPFFNLYPEAKASSEALSYLQAQADTATFKEAYALLYPAYGTYIGGAFGNYLAFPWNYAVQVSVVIPAHIVGRVKAAHVPERLKPHPLPASQSVSPRR
jgi:hypothetical protein